jgi:hypothetical protein
MSTFCGEILARKEETTFPLLLKFFHSTQQKWPEFPKPSAQQQKVQGMVFRVPFTISANQMILLAPRSGNFPAFSLSHQYHPSRDTPSFEGEWRYWSVLVCSPAEPFPTVGRREKTTRHTMLFDR